MVVHFQFERRNLSQHNSSNQLLHESLLLATVKNLAKENQENRHTIRTLQNDNLEMQKTLHNQNYKMAAISDRCDRLEKRKSRSY